MLPAERVSILHLNPWPMLTIVDNHMINGTKLLNVAGMTRGRRDGILKSEKIRHVVKIGPMHLKGVWYVFFILRLIIWATSKTNNVGSHLNVHLNLPTKKRSPICCILCLSTTSVVCCTTRPTRRVRTWLFRNRSSGAWKARRLHEPLVRSPRPCIIIIRCRRRYRRTWRSRHTAWHRNRAVRRSTGHTRSRPRQPVPRVSWASRTKGVLTSGVTRGWGRVRSRCRLTRL